MPSRSHRDLYSHRPLVVLGQLRRSKLEVSWLIFAVEGERHFVVPVVHPGTGVDPDVEVSSATCRKAIELGCFCVATTAPPPSVHRCRLLQPPGHHT